MGDRRLVGGIAFEQTLTSYIEVDLGPEAHFVCIACQPPPYVADQSEASLAVALKCHLRVNPSPYITQYSACFHLFFPFRSRVVGLHIGLRSFSETSRWFTLFESNTLSHRLSVYRDSGKLTYFLTRYFNHAAGG
ncbi:hypothetical protein K443DRAFT_130239 [Laccaria amethystina LaAM-08-1]|uniref:Uncharacterized protein n=1 Tax=Laccaria amethystina LaAM-08-1 TaxID=1095629 RepID=A0A0C9XWA0_9AGAR|nr:hypothetical protein K443DRAFT_130239 [Laccaria amethystina LaAM-08-1]